MNLRYDQRNKTVPHVGHLLPVMIQDSVTRLNDRQQGKVTEVVQVTPEKQ